jgi:hypothetical protein
LVNILKNQAERCIFGLWCDNIFAPPFWEWPAFVTNLDMASNNQFPCIRTRAALSELAASGPDSPANVQALAANKLKKSLFQSDWIARLAQKSAQIHPDLEIEIVNMDLDQTKTVLKQLGPAIAIPVSKSWANAWSTASRLQAWNLNFCVFGCSPCADDLRHYVHCPSLWGSISDACPFLHLVGSSPADRLCLADPTWKDFKTLAAAYHCYNIIRGLAHASRAPIDSVRVPAIARHAWHMTMSSTA